MDNIFICSLEHAKAEASVLETEVHRRSNNDRKIVDSGGMSDNLGARLLSPPEERLARYPPWGSTKSAQEFRGDE